MSRKLPQKQPRTGKSLNQAVAGVLRANASLRDMVLGLHRAIMAYPLESLSIASSALLGKLLVVEDENFGEALPIGARHLRQLDRLQAVRSPMVEENYLSACTAYILSNKKNVDRLITFDKEASRLSFEGAADEIKLLLLQLKKVDQQSLTVLKLYAALHSYSDDLINSFLEDNLTSMWTQSALIYPTVYYFTSLPSEDGIDKMLQHFIPKGKECKIERSLIKFLLQPEENWVGGLAFRCYVGLLSHPYDALEYIFQDLEFRVSNGDPISHGLARCYDALAAAFPDHRLALAVRLIKSPSLPTREPQAIVDDIYLGRTTDQSSLLTEILDFAQTTPSLIAPTSPLMESLKLVRWARYPSQATFDELNAYRQRFYVLSGAKLVDAITRGLYLFVRDDPPRERLSILRTILAFGGESDYVWLSPGGYLALRLRSILTSGEQVSRINEVARQWAERSDRLWIAGANWQLAELQHAGKVEDWAFAARKAFPVWVHPRYLSGLDWYWLADVEKTVGLSMFRGNTDLTYVLFLRMLEQFLRESVSLRIVVEPIAKRLGMDQFADWLADEFGVASLAFVRIFLSPETILKLRLTGNYTAALTTRIVLLENGVRRFGYQSALFAEEDLLQEQNALTATLSRMSIGARQFEIPWETLKVDANARNRDTFSTYVAMSSTITDSTISNTRRSATYPYANGASADYDAFNKDIPLVLVLGGIVDTYLTHPSAGLESILSVRIRHDSFRREFSYSLASIQSSEIQGLSRGRVRIISREIEQGVNREIQNWLDTYMHTRRKEKIAALFDVIPSKGEMNNLVDAARHLTTLDEMIDLVFGWLEPKLEASLSVVRSNLVGHLLLRSSARLTI